MTEDCFICEKMRQSGAFSNEEINQEHNGGLDPIILSDEQEIVLSDAYEEETRNNAE